MIYLDNAATTYPKPPEVIRAMIKTMQEVGANPGRSGHKMAIEAGKIIYHTREALADYFNAQDALQFILTSNCTEALNLALLGVLKENDHVIATALEHNSVLRPLDMLVKKKNVNLTIISPGKNGCIHPDTLSQMITAQTKLVCINAVSNVIGVTQPLYDIYQVCRAKKVMLLVDMAQGAGMVPLDLNHIPVDFLAAPGHKGLYGPQGTGFLYVKKGIELEPLKCGGTGTFSLSLNQPNEIPEGMESGTLNTPGYAGLCEGIGFVKKNQAEIIAHEADLARYLFQSLEHMPKIKLYTPYQKQQNGVISFNIENMPSTEVADALDSNDIACRAGIHCAPLAHRFLGTEEQGAVRLSLSFFNTKKHIDSALQCIYDLTEGI